ncbi:PucR family transcriptional regulator [Nakamurella antarctica]|uniref:PucR family transcriptional regulator n=1 Tax=Nakamurella antarctica TaxID=1902245 RepID=UPI0013DE21A9|nr:PucR family transcriptional regulator [Nakamurella antarctica]
MLRLVRALGRRGITASAEELGFFVGQLFDGDSRPDLGLFVTRTLGPLNDHDAGGGAPLLPSVEAFVSNDGHLARSAHELRIHINTLYSRLKSVDTFLGPGWRRGDQRLELALAFRLRGLQRTLVRSELRSDRSTQVGAADPTNQG